MAKTEVFSLILLLSVLLVAGCVEETPTVATPDDSLNPDDPNPQTQTPTDPGTTITPDISTDPDTTTDLSENGDSSSKEKPDSSTGWNGPEMVLIAPASEIFNYASSYAFAEGEGYADIAEEVSLNLLSGGMSGGEVMQPNMVTIIKLKDSKTFDDFKNHKNNTGSTTVPKEYYKNYSIYEMTDPVNETVIEVASRDKFIIIPGSTQVDVKKIIDDSGQLYAENKALFDLLETSGDTAVIEFIDVFATLSGMPNNVGSVPEWMLNVSKMITALDRDKNNDGLNEGKTSFEVSGNPEEKMEEIQEAFNKKENLTLSNGTVIDGNIIVFDMQSLIEN